jgi:hypothetical protein
MENTRNQLTRVKDLHKLAVMPLQMNSESMLGTLASAKALVAMLAL